MINLHNLNNELNCFREHTSENMKILKSLSVLRGLFLFCLGGSRGTRLRED